MRNEQRQYYSTVEEENTALTRAVEELTVLNEMAQAAAISLDLNEMLKTIVKRSLQALQAEQGVITLVDENNAEQTKTLVRIIVRSSEDNKFHFNEGLLGWMLLNKQPLLLNDPAHNVQFNRIPWEEPISSLLCVPMMIKGNLTGVITVYNSTERAFNQNDQRLLTIIASQMSHLIENTRLEEERREMQIRIARDLHDDIASSLSSIALYAESVKRLLRDAPPQAIETIDKMTSLSHNAVDTMGDIVWSIAPEHDSLNDLFIRLKNLTIDLCSTKEIRHHVSIPEDLVEKELSVVVRRNIFLIFKEALNNILTHSHARNIFIKIVLHHGLFEMMIHDDGIGYKLDRSESGSVSNGGHGLKNMEKRAREIDAKLSIVSEKEKGTTLILSKKMT